MQFEFQNHVMKIDLLQAGRFGVRIRCGQGIFLLSTLVQTVAGAETASWVREIFPGGKAAGVWPHERPTSNAEFQTGYKSTCGP